MWWRIFPRDQRDIKGSVGDIFGTGRRKYLLASIYPPTTHVARAAPGDSVSPRRPARRSPREPCSAPCGRDSADARTGGPWVGSENISAKPERMSAGSVRSTRPLWDGMGIEWGPTFKRGGAYASINWPGNIGHSVIFRWAFRLIKIRGR